MCALNVNERCCMHMLTNIHVHVHVLRSLAVRYSRSRLLYNSRTRRRDRVRERPWGFSLGKCVCASPLAALERERSSEPRVEGHTRESERMCCVDVWRARRARGCRGSSRAYTLSAPGPPRIPRICGCGACRSGVARSPVAPPCALDGGRGAWTGSEEPWLGPRGVRVRGPCSQGLSLFFRLFFVSRFGLHATRPQPHRTR